MALKIGSKAPDFTVNDQDGKPVTLSDLKGKKIVLYFYPADLTPTCTTEACNLRDNYKMLLKRGYEVLGISPDTEKKHLKFIAKEKLPFRLLSDVDLKVHNLYGTWGDKVLFGREYKGTLRTTFVINEEGIIEDIIDKVVSKDHAAQILKELNAPAKTTAKKGTAKKK
ncbi:MAG TPA: thioredoxin-dependent thiol peroxidase [Chryseolinea sp.]|nr:thioredoxin-dependent thiol peroxidase [Chryseolinea sp.]HPM31870.1 thioredoxin-dependent thiol peroxidase [Chryseolinea sp.]